MKFCSQCGVTLSILDSTSSELCTSCIKKNAPEKQPEKTQQTDIFSTTLSHRDGKLFLESKEGWLLWSGPDSEPHSLQLILNRAERILKIRKRQKK